MPTMHTRRRGKQANGYSIGSSTSKPRLAFVDLPFGTQNEIFNHVPRKQLIKCQLVSKHFHSLASAKLYNVLEFTLTHTDAPNYYTKPDTRFADALHTFATSSHDYAQYVKLFRLELSDRDTEEVQKKVLSKYHFEEDATRLLNTALLLMLRRAQKLERFVWDTSIELSGHIYHALCNIHSLHALHVRLDTLPVHRTASFSAFATPNAPHHVHPPALPPSYTTPHQFSTAYPTSASKTPLKVVKRQRANPFMVLQSRRQFSGFTYLRDLHIVGIDELECLAEIAQCVSTCSATLKTLTLSLSHDLARKARTLATPSAPVHQPSESELDDDEDDETEPPVSQQPSTANSQSLAANDADIRKEKGIQDSILAKIFGLEAITAEDKYLDKHLETSAKSLKPYKDDANQIFMEELKKVMTKLIQAKSAGKGITPKDNNILELLGKAAEKYIQSGENKPKKSKITNGTSKAHAAGSHIESSYAVNSHAPGPYAASPFTVPHSSHYLLNTSEADYYDYIMSGGNPNKLLNKAPIAPPLGSNLPYLSFGIDPIEDVYDVTSPGSLELAGTGHPGSIHVSDATSPVWQQAYAEHINSMPLPTFGSSSNGLSQSLWGSSSSGPSKVSYKESLYGVKKAAFDNLKVSDPKTYKKLLNMEQHNEKPGQSVFSEYYKDLEDEISDTEASAVEDSRTPELQAPHAAPIFPATTTSNDDIDDSMDVDMEHPDVVDGEGDEDQEIIDVNEADVPLPKKDNSVGKLSSESWDSQFESAVGTSTKSVLPEVVESRSKQKNGSINLAKADKASLRPQSADETMQEYIRTKHGFHIEDLALYLVPIKASVIGKALDLTFLRRITLLNVGSQAGFWTLVCRMQKESVPIRFESIHTDDATMAFLSCLPQFEGLTDLFMMKRSSKDADSSTSKSHASLTDIRLSALRKHVATLKRLVIMNNDDESWDVDAKCLRLLAAKGAGLEELGISLSIRDYHVLMQNLPGLANLIALNIIAIRTDDRCASVVRECRKFTIDTINHCPGLKIRYIGMTDMVFEIARKPRAPSLIRKSIVKGKGKAKDVDGITGELGTESDDFSDIESGGLEMAVIKHLKFCEVEEVKIFDKRIRTGKL